jgi:uncharacterized protein YggU (UPF0235/DUF167 family)
MFLKVKLHPKSKKQKIEKVSDEKFEIWVKSKAEENKANYEMLEILAEFLEIEKNKLRLISGHHRPGKMIEIL